MPCHSFQVSKVSFLFYSFIQHKCCQDLVLQLGWICSLSVFEKLQRGENLIRLCHVLTRVVTIQYVDVSIYYCLWCITIQWFIVRYKVESKHCSVLLLREMNHVFFFEKHHVPFRLTTMYNNLIKKKTTIHRYITIRNISIQFWLCIDTSIQT